MWLCYPVYKKIHVHEPIIKPSIEPIIETSVKLPNNSILELRGNLNQCQICNYIVISPHNKCEHKYCNYCIKTQILYHNNKCVLCN